MTAGRPDIYVSVDQGRGLVLVYGHAARRVVWLISKAEPRWSVAGRGWVLPADRVPDVQAYAEHFHLLCVVHDRRGAGQVG